MLLNPRYGSGPVLHLDGDPAAVGELLVRQRRRVLSAVEHLTAEQWAHQSRCAEWSVQDVAAHLASTNRFWEASIRAGVAGEPTRMLSAFDPVATPARMVEESARAAEEIVDAMSTTNESLATTIAGLSTADWDALAESPPGHVSVNAVAHHALWDSWIHERDMLLPLGGTPAEEDEEIVACLRYVAGLTPALALNAGAVGVGGFDVSTSAPDAGFHVEIGADVSVTDGATGSEFVLTGGSVDLVEALSFRAPLDREIPHSLDWAFAGLSTVFDH